MNLFELVGLYFYESMVPILVPYGMLYQIEDLNLDLYTLEVN